ncbi:MAG TPA: cytochrome c oxidase subunit 3 [Longimicrobiales bacterium]|nr:cytochrome c oxidase subunit 3 [Longimicrobiales bacterium]
MANTAVVHEHPHHPEPYTATGLPTLKLGFWVFLGSETLFFGSLISMYMVYKHESVVGPYSTELLDIPLTSISTFVLLMSSLAMVIALDQVQQGSRRGGAIGIAAVAVLGSLFLGFQAYEFTHFYHEGLTLQTNLFGSSFFVLTGFHGAHVSLGVIWLLVLLIQLLRGGLPPGKSLQLEIAGLYWHFVDIVWIAIFTLVYLIE